MADFTGKKYVIARLAQDFNRDIRAGALLPFEYDTKEAAIAAASEMTLTDKAKFGIFAPIAIVGPRPDVIVEEITNG